MSLDTDALSSLSSSLDDLTRRLGDLARTTDSDDEALGEILEVQRQLQTAGRRLEKVVRRISSK